MILNINQIPYRTYNNSLIKRGNNTEPTKTNSDVSFGAKVVKLKKPVLENKSVQALSNKISSFLEKIPNDFSINKPVLTTVGDDIVGFTINKTEAKTNITIKRKDLSDKIIDWNANKEFCEILTLVLNNKGQMIEGSYSKAGAWNYGYLFERNEKNIRRLKFAGMTFTPTAGDNNTWKAINRDERLIIGNNVPLNPQSYKLRDLYYELIKLDTAL